MRGKIEDWKSGWYGISLGLSVPEIDRLVVLLTKLRDDSEQHFHISSDCSGNGGLGDIEIYVTEAGVPSNLKLGNVALAPSSDVPGAGA